MTPSRAGTKKKRVRKPGNTIFGGSRHAYIEVFRGELYVGIIDHCGAWEHLRLVDARRLIKWLETYVAWAEERG